MIGHLLSFVIELIDTANAGAGFQPLFEWGDTAKAADKLGSPIESLLAKFERALPVEHKNGSMHADKP